jgi:hypothetical protein
MTQQAACTNLSTGFVRRESLVPVQGDASILDGNFRYYMRTQ